MIKPLISRYFELSPERRLRYLANDNSGKPKLLLLHGVNSRAEFFEEFIPFVGADYDVFAPDFRGHGESFRSHEPYTLNNYAADISVFIAQVIRQPFDLVGMSLGGRIGLILAHRHRHEVKKLIVVDVGPDVDPAGLQRIFKAQQAMPASFPNRAELDRFYAQAYRAVSPHYVERIIRYGWKATESGEMVTSYDRGIWSSGLDSAIQDAADLNALVPEIQVPVLVIRGGLSDILTADDAQKFVHRLPNGTLVEIPNTTHGVLLEETALCADLVRDFLST